MTAERDRKRKKVRLRDLPDEAPPKKQRVYGKRKHPKPLPNGLTPGNPGNSGGKPGRSGRTPVAFKKFCQRLTMGKNSQRALKRIFRLGAMHPDFLNALKWASAHGYGMPKQAVDVQGGLTLETILAKSNEPDEED